eukprot:6467479-Amphidinium_carterae.1
MSACLDYIIHAHQSMVIGVEAMEVRGRLGSNTEEWNRASSHKNMDTATLDTATMNGTNMSRWWRRQCIAQSHLANKYRHTAPPLPSAA